MSDVALEIDPKYLEELSIASLVPIHRRLPELFRTTNQGFAANEHRQLGDRLYLWQPQSLEGIQSNFMDGKIQVAPGIVLSYGQIIALAGDLYGVPDRPISSGKDEKDRRKRFIEAYDTLRNCDRAELAAIIKIMDEEGRSVADWMAEGNSASHAYHHGQNWDERYARATGYWTTGFINTGRYLDLAKRNFDHFGHDAVKAYSAGHAEAIDKALEGYNYLKGNSGTAAKQHAATIFETALAMSAFADHYLTDLFSSGHLRVPRRRLADDWDHFQGYGAAGSLMAKRQHGEDGTYGLFVRNACGERWRSYGDEHLGNFPGRHNKLRAFLALQESMIEVWRAFQYGEKPQQYAALKRTPDLDLVAKHESEKSHNNYAAAYISRDGDIHYRRPMSNIDHFHWEKLASWRWPWEYWGDKESAFETWRSGGENWYWNWQMPFPDPSKIDLKAPPPPEYVRSQTPNPPQPKQEGPAQVRYALAVEAVHRFTDGGTCTYSSEVGAWGPWIDRHPVDGPMLRVPAVKDKRVTRRFVIRQFKGRAPRIDLLDLNGNEGFDVIAVPGNEDAMVHDVTV